MRTHPWPGRARALALLTAAALATAGIAAVRLRAHAAEPVPPSLTKAIKDITGKPVYAHSTWSIQIADRATGAVLLDQGGNQMRTTGSVLKLYSSSTALHDYGQDHKFTTPVYRTGQVRNGALQGDLVLVASGDLSMGLREQPNGNMAYASAPSVDHTYANTGLPAIEVGANPLAGVEDLASGGVGDHEREGQRHHRRSPVPDLLRVAGRLRVASIADRHQ
jgi:D-alanyl-D-alanine carboxypeptidase/D-alanyl-D-alanine-endopeptidase (penicillin-binding protein 4)